MVARFATCNPFCGFLVSAAMRVIFAKPILKDVRQPELFLRDKSLVIAGIGICAALFSAVVFRLVYGKYFNGVIPTDEFGALFEALDKNWPGPGLERTGRILMTISKVAYWGIVGPVFWLIAFLRIREVEVKDGV